MREVIELIKSNVAISVLAIALGTLLAGLLADLVTSRVLLRLTSRTRTNLDDEIIAAVRKPLFLSVLLIGIGLVLWRIQTPATWQRLVNNVLITIGVPLQWNEGIPVAVRYFRPW